VHLAPRGPPPSHDRCAPSTESAYARLMRHWGSTGCTTQIGMAYDMFVGDNANDEGPCPPGQIVMLVRTLPQLATAMGHYENGPVDMQDIAVKATRIIQRLVRSSEGCRELLAHPVCSSASRGPTVVRLPTTALPGLKKPA